ncbi:MAG: hypothetical protein NC355_09810 [Blautia sp.]|nr:hypothetical protein [Blautia sp.]
MRGCEASACTVKTTTHTDKKPFELCKAICNKPDWETLAYAIVGRLWEMEVNAAEIKAGAEGQKASPVLRT